MLDIQKRYPGSEMEPAAGKGKGDENTNDKEGDLNLSYAEIWFMLMLILKCYKRKTLFYAEKQLKRSGLIHSFLIGLDLARIMELNLARLSASLYKPDACSIHAAAVSCFLLFHWVVVAVVAAISTPKSWDGTAMAERGDHSVMAVRGHCFRL
jgi:hypothetical protein